MPRRPVAGHRVEIVSDGVLAPLPHVAAHVAETELIRRLFRDGMGLRRQRKFESTREAPADAPAEQLAQRAMRAREPWTVPRDGVGVIAAAERKVLAPMRTAARGVLPLGLGRQPEAKGGIAGGNGREHFARVDAFEKAAGACDVVP